VRDECDDWFDAIDEDRNGELSYGELHAALLNNNGATLFASNTVKYLVSIFDRDGDGVIRRDEFRPLWEYLTDWRRMFDSFDADNDGRIDAGELGRALGHYGIQVNRGTLDKLVRKHSSARRGHRPEMDLDQFVCACVVVRRMCQLYDSCNAGGGSSISKDDFLQAVIALP
jgi:Ca2+-binding EF-hand superfamily protein